MANFCTCGSLMIDDRCTNKNCASRQAKAGSSASAPAKAAKGKAKEKKPTRTRRASKCITYNLYDKEEKEEENVN